MDERARAEWENMYFLQSAVLENIGMSSWFAQWVPMEILVRGRQLFSSKLLLGLLETKWKKKYEERPLRFIKDWWV